MSNRVVKQQNGRRRLKLRIRSEDDGKYNCRSMIHPACGGAQSIDSAFAEMLSRQTELLEEGLFVQTPVSELVRVPPVRSVSVYPGRA
jgi:hypothetical protein